MSNSNTYCLKCNSNYCNEDNHLYLYNLKLNSIYEKYLELKSQNSELRSKLLHMKNNSFITYLNIAAVKIKYYRI